MKDPYHMSHYCKNGSLVKYYYDNGVKMVSEKKVNGDFRYAEYENGSWIEEQNFLNM